MNLEEIRRRIGKKEGWENNFDYQGLRMDKTHSQEEENEDITKHNERIIDLFSDKMDSELIKKCFDCWKGICFLNLKRDKNYWHENIKEFSGECSEDIIHWLIKYGQEEIWEKIGEGRIGENWDDKEKEVYRIITKKDRYEVLRRQKWKCNICSEGLKYNSKSDWEGKIAHIDHIHPYTKRDTYSNGKENINELENLQALCPDCNLKKGEKDVN